MLARIDMESTRKSLLPLMIANPNVIHLTLERCEFCSLGFESEDLFEVANHKACASCKEQYHADIEAKRIEDKIQDAMNELPTDQLLTIQWAFSIAFETLQDKNEVPLNIQKWLSRAKESIAFKGLQSKKH